MNGTRTRTGTPSRPSTVWSESTEKSICWNFDQIVNSATAIYQWTPRRPGSAATNAPSAPTASTNCSKTSVQTALVVLSLVQCDPRLNAAKVSVVNINLHPPNAGTAAMIEPRFATSSNRSRVFPRNCANERRSLQTACFAGHRRAERPGRMAMSRCSAKPLTASLSAPGWNHTCAARQSTNS